jgi:hypothetical protein
VTQQSAVRAPVSAQTMHLAPYRWQDQKHSFVKLVSPDVEPNKQKLSPLG